MLPVLAWFFGAGRLVRARNEAARSLRLRSAELRRQRERTAELAVRADRARVAEDLDEALRARIADIARAASAGLAALDRDPAAARSALASIERHGREVLRHMREVLGTLHYGAPGEPQPALAQLPELLARATTARTRLSVEGSQRLLPAGLELSGYRIVEHLVAAMADAPEAAISVGLRFGPEALELRISGPPGDGADHGAALAAARERACLHGGTLDTRTAGSQSQAVIRLPLVSGHA
jgi:hypothetical protein